jgi:hypothetical protein
MTFGITAPSPPGSGLPIHRPKSKSGSQSGRRPQIPYHDNNLSEKRYAVNMAFAFFSSRSAIFQATDKTPVSRHLICFCSSQNPCSWHR